MICYIYLGYSFRLCYAFLLNNESETDLC
jgi:hypothetical protein